MSKRCSLLSKPKAILIAHCRQEMRVKWLNATNRRSLHRRFIRKMSLILLPKDNRIVQSNLFYNITTSRWRKILQDKDWMMKLSKLKTKLPLLVNTTRGLVQDSALNRGTLVKEMHPIKQEMQSKVPWVRKFLRIILLWLKAKRLETSQDITKIMKACMHKQNSKWRNST